MTEPELDPEKEHQRLDDLGRRIDATRHEADKLDPTKDEEETFASSGTVHPEEDDENASPA